ncbi:MAG: hypothetical protein GX552_15015, partial [Chloroflexi bacterium]|nr:hypothetical protein [Chloroflexota bacterium]
MHNRHGHATITSLSIIVLSLLLLGMLPHRLGDNAALAATRADALGARLNAGVAWESEAEDGTVAYPMIVWEDPEALGGKFVYCSHGWSEGMVTFTVNIETAATYYLWARVKGEGWTKNSFYVHMDDGDPIEYEIPQFGGDWVWGWDLVRPVDRAPVAFALEAGEHTLSFQVREPNAKLDRLLLTDDPTYLPEGASTPLYIWRQEAETGTLSDAMNRGEDIGASACEYVSSSSGFSNAKVTIKFDVVVPGNYYVWVRTRGQDYQHNSFFVSVDESSEFHYEVPQFKEAWDWGWDIVHPDKQEVQPVALD